MSPPHTARAAECREDRAVAGAGRPAPATAVSVAEARRRPRRGTARRRLPPTARPSLGGVQSRATEGAPHEGTLSRQLRSARQRWSVHALPSHSCRSGGSLGGAPTARPSTPGLHRRGCRASDVTAEGGGGPAAPARAPRPPAALERQHRRTTSIDAAPTPCERRPGTVRGPPPAFLTCAATTSRSSRPARRRNAARPPSSEDADQRDR